MISASWKVVSMGACSRAWQMPRAMRAALLSSPYWRMMRASSSWDRVFTKSFAEAPCWLMRISSGAS